jgi:lipid A 4'-phosphatase
LSQRLTIITGILTLCAGAIFAAWPNIDLSLANWFYANGEFYGQGTAARIFRKFFFYLPVAILAILVAAWVFRRLTLNWKPSNWLAKYSPSTRGLLFSVFTLALGPGLVVNLGLKEHWNRPRPVQVQEFGGSAQFKPWWRTDGACQRNCSFVSGEVSGGFWLVAPASLAPPPVRTLAVAGALVVGTLTAVGRVAFGGHFLSDVVFAALLTMLICQGLYFAMFIRPRRPPPPS